MTKWKQPTKNGKPEQYAYIVGRPYIKIAICTVAGVVKYAVYHQKECISVHLDREEAKKIAEGL